MQRLSRSSHRAAGPRTIRIWQILGGVWILLAGFPLHSAFEWSGYWRPLAVFAPVNESVWEHLKLVFWPGLCFALVEYGFLARRTANFVAAQCLGLCTMPLVIVGLFYAYTGVLGDNYLVIDVLIFVLAIIAGQWVSYRMLTRHSIASFWHIAGRTGVAFFLVAFPLFTFYPPPLVLFEHAGSGMYGILEKPAR